MRKRVMAARACAMSAAWVAFGSAAMAHAEDAAQGDPIVVTAPGGTLDADDALHLNAHDLARAGTPDLLGALSRNIAGVTLQDAQGNPWQPNLVYRGFIASPLQGQAQGLAAYMDGVRFNQPFGDTVQFDLIPESAIRSLSLLDASPVYGLNALGGAIVMETKTGVSDPGLEASITDGRFGYVEGNAGAGFRSGAFSTYVAGQVSHDDGWRDFSPSRLYNGYADLGFDLPGGGLHMKIVGADTNLTGNGVSPVELLAADRRAIYTAPDTAISHYGRVSLHPWVALSDETRLEGSLYAQRLTLRTLNGDSADIEPCDEDAPDGPLCLSEAGDGDDDADSGDMLTAANGAVINGYGDDLAYGVLNRGNTRTDALGFLFQLSDERPIASGTNHLVLGVSYDSSRTRFNTSTELGFLDDVRFVEGLGPVIVQDDGAIAPVDLTARTDYWGLFIQDRLPVTDRLSIELGLRYNDAHIVLRDHIGTALNGDHRFRKFNPGVEVDYELSEAISLRAGFAQTNRAPTPAELSCADENAPCSLANFFIADPPLKQVVASNWEAGASGSGKLGGFSLNWLLSFYRATNRDDIQFAASAIRGRAYFRNIGSTRRQGAELQLKASRGGFTASLSYAFTDATYGDALTLTSPANPAADEDGLITVQPGDRLPGIPRHSATLSLDYAGKGWSVGGDIMARSGQYLAGDEGNDTRRLPGYAIVNLRGSVDILKGVSIFGELRNAFNRDYATFGTFSEVDEVYLAQAPGASNPRAYGPGAPRRWYVGVKAAF